MEKLSAMDPIRLDASKGAALILECRRKIPISDYFHSQLANGNLDSWQDIKESYEDLLRLNSQVVDFTKDKLNEYCLVAKGKEHSSTRVRNLIENLSNYDASLRDAINQYATRIVAVAAHAIVRAEGYLLWNQVVTKFIPGLMRLSDKSQSKDILLAVRTAWVDPVNNPEGWNWGGLRRNLLSADALLSEYSGTPADDELIAKVEMPPSGVKSGQLRVSGMKKWLEEYSEALDLIDDHISNLPTLPPSDDDLASLESNSESNSE